MKTKVIRWVWLGLFLTTIAFLGIYNPAKADIAPPQLPLGGNVQPGGTTKVRMLAEEVLIYPQLDQLADNGQNLGVLDWAKVIATFKMRNQGTTTEKMDVWFPLTDPNGNGYGPLKKVMNFKIRVNYAATTWKEITTPAPANTLVKEIFWAVFQITFPPMEDVVIDVTYDQQASGYKPYSSFGYILQTGSGWDGTIGKAELIIRMPYEVSTQNYYEINATKPGILDGNDIRWVYEDLEPTEKDNLTAFLIEPNLWQNVLKARTAVETNPNDGNAWGTLAKALKQVSLTSKGWPREDPGGKELFQESINAYEKAIALSPDVAKWHAGYGELLWHTVASLPGSTDPMYRKSITELRTALMLDPTNVQAITIIEDILLADPMAIEKNPAGGYRFLLLTATVQPSAIPTIAIPTATEFIEPTMTETSIPTATLDLQPTYEVSPTEIVTSEPNTSKPFTFPFCGGSLLFPAGMLLGWYFLRISRSGR